MANCLHLGEQVGNVVLGCCNGAERSVALHACRHADHVGLFATPHLPAAGVATIELTGGERTANKVLSCQSCQVKLVSISPLRLPINPQGDKPISNVRRAWEDARRARWPSNPAHRAVLIDCNRDGIGDTVVAAWIAEGAKQASREQCPQVVLCAGGERRELLRMLGQEVNYPSAPGHAAYHGTEYARGVPAVGSPPFVQVRAAALGINAIPRRPPISIPPPLRQWSDKIDVDVLLFPQACEGSRVWPVKHWSELADRLAETGAKLHILGLEPCELQSSPYWWSKLSILQVAALMTRAKLIIGNDSGPMHLAGTLDRPAIAVHGRTTDVVYCHTPSVRCLQAVRSDVPCAGCWFGWGYDQSACEKSCKALASITVDNVLQAAREVL